MRSLLDIIDESANTLVDARYLNQLRSWLMLCSPGHSRLILRVLLCFLGFLCLLLFLGMMRMQVGGVATFYTSSLFCGFGA